MQPSHLQPTIHQLDTLTIDKIAAGEIIEGPASCIKELVDNATDAQATFIQIELGVGGREWIKVTDDGIGMNSVDAVICIERHTTSKLQSISDLDLLSTKGFRGEALCSIAAVSQCTITTCKRATSSNIEDGKIENSKEHTIGKNGSQLVVHGGKIIAVDHAISAPFGTCVEIKSLFYNIPVRRKFLKSPQKDAQDIYKTIVMLALASPHIGFKYIVDKVSKLSLACYKKQSRPDFEIRIQDILGSEVTAQGHFFFRTFGKDTKIYGFIGSPQHAKSNRSLQYVLVNSRPIQSLMLSYAVKAGYATSIGKDQHPVFVLYLDIDPSTIDINVHPQKKEIRFQDEESIRILIQEIIGEELFGKYSKIDERPFCEKSVTENNFSQTDLQQHIRHQNSNGQASHSSSSCATAPSYTANAAFTLQTPPSLPIIKVKSPLLDSKYTKYPDWQKQTHVALPDQQQDIEIDTQETVFVKRASSYNENAAHQMSADSIPSYKAVEVSSTQYNIIQILESDYAILSLPLLQNKQQGDTVLINIRHALKAVLTAQIVQSQQQELSQQHRVVSEPLVVPYLLRLSKDQAEYTDEIMDEICQLGFVLRPFGIHTYLIEAVPQGTAFAKLHIESFFSSLCKLKESKDSQDEEALGNKSDFERHACRKAAILLTSFHGIQQAGSIVLDMARYIIYEWISLGMPIYALSGERIWMSVDNKKAHALFVDAP